MTDVDRQIEALEAQVAADRQRANRIANQLMLGAGVTAVALVPLQVLATLSAPLEAGCFVLALLPLAWCTPRYVACSRRIADAMREVAALQGQKSDPLRLDGEVAG